MNLFLEYKSVPDPCPYLDLITKLILLLLPYSNIAIRFSSNPAIAVLPYCHWLIPILPLLNSNIAICRICIFSLPYFHIAMAVLNIQLVAKRLIDHYQLHHFKILPLSILPLPYFHTAIAVSPIQPLPYSILTLPYFHIAITVFQFNDVFLILPVRYFNMLWCILGYCVFGLPEEEIKQLKYGNLKEGKIQRIFKNMEPF